MPHIMSSAFLLRRVSADEALLSPRATCSLTVVISATPLAATIATSATTLNTLTDRERKVVILAARGMNNDQIAAALWVSPLIAKTHTNRSMSKLRVRDRAQLVVIADQTGLVRTN
jgi:DNA-binding NarL/FixJ family response regulator